MILNPFRDTMSDAAYARIHDNYLMPPEPEDEGWREREVVFEFECDADVTAEDGLGIVECDFEGDVEAFISWNGELNVECPKCGSEASFEAETYGFAADPEYDER